LNLILRSLGNFSSGRMGDHSTTEPPRLQLAPYSDSLSSDLRSRSCWLRFSKFLSRTRLILKWYFQNLTSYHILYASGFSTAGSQNYCTGPWEINIFNINLTV